LCRMVSYKACLPPRSVEPVVDAYGLPVVRVWCVYVIV